MTSGPATVRAGSPALTLCGRNGARCVAPPAPDPENAMTRSRALRPVLAVLLALVACLAPACARADGAANRDSVYLVGEFTDPVCFYQHGMSGVDQRQCALVRGRVNQGIAFYDIRGGHVYNVIGMTHTDDPYNTFFDHLGDTLAITGKVWGRGGGRAIAITGMYPWRAQPRGAYALRDWTWHASTLVGCALLAALYLLALTRWRRRLGGPARFPAARATTFLAGLLVLLAALNGPLHDLSDGWFFWAHMVQHLVLAQIVPLLLLLGIPAWLADRLLARPRVRGAWEALTDYRVGFALYTTVFVGWHVAPLYDLMMRDHNVHILMHLMTLASATIMWWPFLGTAANARRLEPPAQMLYVLALSTPMMAVAAFLVFAKEPLYTWYALAPRLWNMSALEDQRLGGLIMWIPGTMVYWSILSVIFLRWSHARENTAPLDDMVIPAMPRGR